MRFRVLAVSVLINTVTLVVGSTLPIMAHHAHPAGLFNDTFSDVEGIVKEVRFRPPHVWVILEVRGNGPESQLWPLEAAGPAALQAIGITSDSIKANDVVKARCRRLRDVPKGQDNDCILGFLKIKGQAAKDWSGDNSPVPADF